MVWSADGTTLAYVVRDAENCDVLYILRVRTSGGNQPAPTRVLNVCGTFTSGGILSPTWSPDGKTIAFVTFYGSTGFGTRLMTVNVATGATRVIYAEPDRKCTSVMENAAYAPDGQSIAVTTYENCAVAVFKTKFLFIRPSGGIAASFTEPYYPVDLDWSRDGSRLLFIGEGPGGKTGGVMVLSPRTARSCTAALPSSTSMPPTTTGSTALRTHRPARRVKTGPCCSLRTPSSPSTRPFFTGLPADDTIKATVLNSKLTLPPSPLVTLQSGQTVRNQSPLKFSGSLPAKPGKYELTIKWTAVRGTDTVPVGSTKLTVYITDGTSTPPGGLPLAQDVPALSLINFGSLAAAKSPGSVVIAITDALGDKAVYQPSLDTQTGAVSSHGPLLSYYHNGWALSCEWNGAKGACDRTATCQGLPDVLTTGSLHCGDWASYGAVMFAFQGVMARYVDVGDDHNFYPGPPADGSSSSTGHYGYMLVAPWIFGHPFTGTCAGHTFTLPPPYKYVDALKFDSKSAGTLAPCSAGGQLGLTFAPSNAIAQGQVHTPPGMFTIGDHAITYADGQYIDPSYGTGPFTTMKQWESASIEGFALLEKLVSGPHGEHLQPINAGYNTTVSQCKDITCYFIAEPEPKGGWP